MRIDREIRHIALPSIITNITIPLLGMVDVAIVGHIGGDDGATVGLGAIAVGTLIFNMVYWIFAFLRMGTSGLTAQAFGRGDRRGVLQILSQSTTVGLLCGLALCLLQYPIALLSHAIIAPSPEVWEPAMDYFRTRIWAAPAVLLLYAASGWFIGMQNSRYPLYVALAQNVANILLSLLFVYAFGMGIVGVALGTALSQYVGLAAAVLLWCRRYGSLRSECGPGFFRQSLHAQSMGRFFTVNRDIMLRTLCIIAVTCAFTSLGARQGDLPLAINSLLIQLYMFYTYFVDGLALAGEALTGKYIGARNPERLRASIRRLFLWGAVVALGFTLVYATLGHPILSLLTDDGAVLAASSPYFFWSLLIPLVAFAAFLWDGVFIGATATRAMLYTLLSGTLAFFGFYYLWPWLTQPASPLHVFALAPNHVLWCSWILYLATRSLVQTMIAPRVLRSAIAT
jgi:MATE family multidrug resistance protein